MPPVGERLVIGSSKTKILTSAVKGPIFGINKPSFSDREKSEGLGIRTILF